MYARSAWFCALFALSSLSCNTPKVAEVDDAGSDGGLSSLSQALVSDRDSDGVVDTSDNCPDVANADQKNSNSAGPGDACELALVLKHGLLSRYALYGSHKQLLILPLPLLFVSQPDLLRITAKAPSNSLAALNLLGPNELGVASPGQILPSQLGAISGNEVLSIGIGQADALRNALARSVWLRVQGTANLSLTFFHGASVVGTMTGSSQPGASIKRFDASAPFDRVEIRATSGSFSIRGQGPAVMFAIGNAQPTCPTGYTRVGTSCVDIDECSGIDRVCDALTTCVNTPGSFTCGACPPGYRGTGATGCTDIDECEEESDACSDLTTCSNTAGSYTCGACPEGYAGDGRTCADLDECTAGTDTCDPLVTCHNTQGSYTCGSCPAGYEGGGATGCTDIDECSGPNHACDALTTCTNTPGSFTCGACPAGYAGDGIAGCADVDECAQGLHNCSPLVTCGNTPGSFQCGDCPSGYRGDGRTCTDVNECSEHSDLCSALVACANTQGGYTCGACPDGYTGDGQTCTDIDECEANPCDSRTACSNSEGSYACGACPAGYVGNGYAGCVDVDECMQESTTARRSSPAPIQMAATNAATAQLAIRATGAPAQTSTSVSRIRMNAATSSPAPIPLGATHAAPAPRATRAMAGGRRIHHNSRQVGGYDRMIVSQHPVLRPQSAATRGVGSRVAARAITTFREPSLGTTFRFRRYRAAADDVERPGPHGRELQMQPRHRAAGPRRPQPAPSACAWSLSRVNPQAGRLGSSSRSTIAVHIGTF
jgi:hypothetical protein